MTNNETPEVSGAPESAAEKTKGELYVEQHYRPHLELPEEMPQEIIQMLERNGSYSSRRSAEIWQLTRNGLGDLLFPSIGWEEHYKVITRALSEELDPQEAEKDLRSDHINLTTLVNLTYQTGLPAGLPTIRGDIGETRPGEVVIFLKKYIDSFSEIEIEYQKIIKQIEDRESELTNEDAGKIADLSGNIVQIMRGKNQLNDLDSHHVIDLAKQMEQIDGIPWYARLAFLNTVRAKIDVSIIELNEAERAVYDDTLGELRMNFGMQLDGASLRRFFETRKSNVEYYLERIT